MHQKCPIWDKNLKKFMRMGLTPRPIPGGEEDTPSPHPIPYGASSPAPSQKTLKEALKYW